ncbi:N-acetylmuramoyl-L-alanine amidase [Paenibacillus sp. SYP-B3998]|uniref:N-acetylmuramoyl-L-alanine amidase n=1 Tax=Paenibacillus sp. SYP-B3998 TaxID=2678564 RepID=A0A6G3ZTS2_9BACL|nr:N-acetylmuramoyl-L-alanine amidase [Paenibacillus sp. SYP-B3998]NEW05104.1 N-acetylmuramoyl-L-alanine amidase [Paenibacillus sp. SYP-B3998]
MERADKIIGVLAAVYGVCVDQTSKDEVHRLANELRKASGQPEQ